MLSATMAPSSYCERMARGQAPSVGSSWLAGSHERWSEATGGVVKYCEGCGKALSEGAAFCAACGRAIAPHVPSSVAAPGDASVAESSAAGVAAAPRRVPRVRLCCLSVDSGRCRGRRCSPPHRGARREQVDDGFAGTWSSETGRVEIVSARQGDDKATWELRRTGEDGGVSVLAFTIDGNTMSGSAGGHGFSFNRQGASDGLYGTWTGRAEGGLEKVTIRHEHGTTDLAVWRRRRLDGDLGRGRRTDRDRTRHRAPMTYARESLRWSWSSDRCDRYARRGRSRDLRAQGLTHVLEGNPKGLQTNSPARRPTHRPRSAEESATLHPGSRTCPLTTSSTPPHRHSRPTGAPSIAPDGSVRWAPSS